MPTVYKEKIGYNIDILQQTARLDFIQLWLVTFLLFLICMAWGGRQTLRLFPPQCVSEGWCLSISVSGWAYRGSVYGFLVFWLQIATEPFDSFLITEFVIIFVSVWWGRGPLHGPTLRKQAYSNILNFLPPKNWKFSDKKKKSEIFYIFAQNIDCGYALEPPRRGGSNAYPQSMFLSRNKKNNVYHCKPQFYYIKVRFKGVRII